MTSSKQQQLTAIDLFSGCGGLSLGFEMEGFQPLLFSEINLNAAQTYMINRRDENIIPFGDIYSLTNDNLRLFKEHWRMRGIEDVDIVCGGPPCQGYSGIGHRRTFKLDKEEIPSNQLYQEMVRVIEFVRPKVFLFENVKGLLSGRWTKNGQKGEIFRDVLAAFNAIEGYNCEWDLVHAKNYGVPQNRPRVLIIGYRNDVWKSYKEPEFNLADEASPYNGGGNAIRLGYLPESRGEPPTLEELLGDIMDPAYSGSGETATYPESARTKIQKYLRKRKDGRLAKRGEALTEHEYSSHSTKVVEKFTHMLENNGEIPDHMKTKKFAQRVLPKVWNGTGPNITATSLPDDYVHYAQPRVPTVREWARIQTFPDWYQFAGPRTTGGRRRAGDPNAGIWDREVPKYTQIGNAVPVLLAKAVAQHIRGVLNPDIPNAKIIRTATE
jgi:DNA (cytosine-5)-methyltransferase 1